MDYIAREKQRCAQNYKPLDVVLERGAGAWLWDVEGRKYLDMMSAYSAVSLGHAHPKTLSAMEKQAHKLSVVSRAFYTDVLGEFLDRLCNVSGFDMALPMNTGAEAVETAIKAARRWGYRVKGIPDGRAEIIVADNNFHGRTTTIIGFSSDEDTKRDFGPFTPGFTNVPFGDIAALEKAITPNTCAIMVEPIQGEAGIIVPPAGWLCAVRELCDQHNVLLILDEIQSGLCRTGRWFAFEHEDIRPDAITVGKALGGGVLPVSAFLARQDIMELFDPGSHGSTFGGNPLAAAVALATLDVMEEENLAARSAALGARMLSRLEALNSPLIWEVRGRGLWVGVELQPGLCRGPALVGALKKEGILSKETHDSVIRLAPPLTISAEDLDWGIDRFGETLRSFEKGAA